LTPGRPRKNGRPATAVFLVLCVSLACASHPPVPVGAIDGVAVDGFGSVLPGITVSLRSPAGEVVQTVFTAENGSYRFEQVPAGRYQVLTVFAGFSTPDPIDVTVAAGGPIHLRPLVLRLPDQAPGGGNVIAAPTPNPR